MNCPFCPQQILEEPLFIRGEMIIAKICKCVECDFNIHYLDKDITRIYITLVKNNEGKVT